MNDISLRAHWGNHYRFECYGPDGKLKWVEEFDNIVVDTGANDMLDKYYAGSAYTAANYLGLTGGTPTFANADTMASHSGWTETTAYSAATRPAPSWSSASSRSKATSSAVSFSMNASYTAGGAFLTTNSTKSGTTGTLIGGGAFSTDRTGGSGDTINVTVTASV